MIEAFDVEADESGWPIPPTAGQGVARLLAVMLRRSGMDADAAAAHGSLWVEEDWQATIVVNGAQQSARASFERGHHLLYRITQFAAEQLGGSLPEVVMRAFEDLQTPSPGALLSYLGGLGADGEERQRQWRRAFELDPRLVAARTGLARGVLERGGDAGAAATLLEAMAIADGAAASELGIALWAAGENAMSAELLQAAVRSNPQDAVALAALAALLARRAPEESASRDNAWDEALLLATQATQLAADDYRCWAALADVHRAGGDFAQAAFYYGFALRLEPDSNAVLKDAGACWLLAKQPRQALPLIERALALAPGDADHHGNLAFARDLEGDAAAALAAARRAAELRPGDARMRILHGDLALKAGRREEALEAWARAAELEPGMVISPEGGNVALAGAGETEA